MPPPPPTDVKPLTETVRADCSDTATFIGISLAPIQRSTLLEASDCSSKNEVKVNIEGKGRWSQQLNSWSQGPGIKTTLRSLLSPRGHVLFKCRHSRVIGGLRGQISVKQHPPKCRRGPTRTRDADQFIGKENTWLYGPSAWGWPFVLLVNKETTCVAGSVAEWSKALVLCACLSRRGFESHRCQIF